MNARPDQSQFECVPISIMDLKPRMCRWPLGDPRSPSFTYCAADTGETRNSYCGSHASVAGLHYLRTAPRAEPEVARKMTDNLFVGSVRNRKPKAAPRVYLRRKMPVIAIEPPRPALVASAPIPAAPKPVEIKLPAVEQRRVKKFIVTHIDGFDRIDFAREPHPLDTDRYAMPIKVMNLREMQRYLDEQNRELIKPPVPKLMKMVSEAFGIKVDVIKGVNRNASIVEARQVGMWFVKAIRPDRSLPQLGRDFGGKNHATVIHAIRKVKAGVRNIPASLHAYIASRATEGEG